MPLPVAYVSRPQLLVGGQSYPDLNDGVLSMLVEETVQGLFWCELRFNNFGPTGSGFGYLYFGRDILEFGADLTVTMGVGDQARDVFKGRISSIEADYPQHGGAEVCVLAEDRLQALRMTRRTRTFEDVTDEDVISQIANEHSLTPELDLNGPTHAVLAQVNQSDLAFIRERARSVNAEVWVEDTTLLAKMRTDREGDAIDLEYGNNLLSFQVQADLAHQCTEVGATGWDVAAKEAIEEVATESAIQAELNGEISGSAILEEAFAPRKERVVHAAPLTSEEARHLAEARFREQARCFVTGSGIADGNPRLRAGSTVNLSALGPLFDGAYYVVCVRYTYDSVHGFRTEFDVERPGLGRA